MGRLQDAIKRNDEGRYLTDTAKFLTFLGIIALLDQSTSLAATWQNFYASWVLPVCASPYGEPAFSVGGVALGGIVWGIIANGMFNLTPLKPKFDGGAPLDAWWLTANIVVFFGSVIVIQEAILKPLNLFRFIYTDTPNPEAPSFLRMVLEVCVSIFFYDFILFWIHKSWHLAGRPTTTTKISSSSKTNFLFKLVKDFWHGVHLAHHDHYQNTKFALWAGATLHHHLLDGGAHVFVSLLVNQIPLLLLGFTERHPASKILHLLVVQWMLVESHSGLDEAFMLHRLLPAFFGGSVRHQVHHDTGGRYYQQFFKYLDDYFLAAAASSSSSSSSALQQQEAISRRVAKEGEQKEGKKKSHFICNNNGNRSNGAVGCRG